MADAKEITNEVETLSIEGRLTQNHRIDLQEDLDKATQVASDVIDHTEQGPPEISYSDDNVTHTNPDFVYVQTCQVCLLFFQTETASYLCLDCDYYLCSVCCNYNHQDHELVIISDKLIHERVKRRVRLEDNPVERFNFENIIVSNNIDVRISENDICDIKRMAVSQNGEVAVITDKKNSCIKIIDLQRNQVVRFIKCSEKPWGITSIPGAASIQTKIGDIHFVAVTFPFEKEILVYDIDKKSILTSYTVFDACFEIVYHDDQFVTLCNRYEKYTRYYLNFLHKSGLTLKIIKLNDSPQLPLVGTEIYFALHPTEQIIYVSNFEESIVLRFNYEGRIQNRFRSQLFAKPTGICIGEDQNIYVSFFSEVQGKSYINRMSLELAELKTFCLWGRSRCEALVHCRDTFYTSLHNFQVPIYSLGAFKIE